jgi:hypothetical protein
MPVGMVTKLSTLHHQPHVPQCAHSELFRILRGLFSAYIQGKKIDWAKSAYQIFGREKEIAQGITP